MTSFKSYWCSKTTAAQYVEDLKKTLSPGSVLTTIMLPQPLGGCSVFTAIGASSGDIEEEMTRCLYFSPRTTISTEIISAGQFHRKQRKRREKMGRNYGVETRVMYSEQDFKDGCFFNLCMGFAMGIAGTIVAALSVLFFIGWIG